MIQVIIAGVLAYGIIILIEKVQKRNDHVATGAIVFATMVLAFFISIAIAAFEMPEWYSIVILPLYFVLPLLILRNMWELSWARSSAYAGVIFGSIIVVESALYLMLTSYH